ncbi:hypothetical protein DEJ34_03850 [Curtobacterium sp. MCPF17_050]|uniref:hypothetical protein n=1 Tax=Curtobacterium sp. MCPF17_050 TaxID=2175664 RepID=UPI0024DF68D5|nr:hypothetical protein [Curtobacterium sp. MCPF17_050]WIB16277.1 hypothetical protein DEJ34_03850 [Curtobacterium sp. MCPF17_050]
MLVASLAIEVADLRGAGARVLQADEVVVSRKLMRDLGKESRRVLSEAAARDRGATAGNSSATGRG